LDILLLNEPKMLFVPCNSDRFWAWICWRCKKKLVFNV